MVEHSADLLVRQGRIIDPASKTDAQGDILICRGRIAQSGPDLQAPPGTPVLEARGLVVAPGFIDVHTHLREPGFTHKETIASGTAAAAAGGICAVCAMPNTNPPPDNADHMNTALNCAKTATVRYYPIACVTVGRKGKGKLAPLEELAALGAVAFSDDGDPIEDEVLMRRALEIARDLDRPIFPHEEVKALTEGGCMHEGEISKRLGVKGMPATGEEQMIARDIELVRQTGGPLHIAHISTIGSVELVRRAKADGLPVTCEVLTHHFALADREVEIQGTAAKMSPPLRSEKDVAAMCAGLTDGTIDIISTDHAPHSAAEKALPLTEAPMGIVGLETAIGLTFSYLVETGVLTLGDAIARWTCNPARILRLPGGQIAEGQLGDLTILDVNREWIVNPATFRSKSQNTPFSGYRLKGKAVATIIGGQVVFSDFAN